MPIMAVPRPPVSTTSAICGELAGPPSTATLRWGDEDSSAKIVIRNAAFGFAESLDLNPTGSRGEGRRRNIEWVCAEPTFGPFDYSDAIGCEVFFKACGDD